MKYIPLVQVCDFQGGSQPPKDQWIDHEKEGYIRMLQIRDFTQPDKENVEFVRISKTIKTCNEDDILIGRYGASVGKILTGLAGAYNVAIIKTIPDTSKLSKRFLYHYLNSPYFQNFILSVGSRAAQAGFNKDDLSDAQIPDLSLEEQSNVVSQLDKVTELIVLRKEQLAKLDQLVKSRFIELFGTPLLNEKGWVVKSTGDVCSVTDGSHFSPVGKEDGYPMLSVRNMRNDGFHYDDCKLVSQEDYDILVKQGCKPLKNDVLIAKDGSYFYYGFVVKEEIEQAVLSSIAILRPNLEQVNPEYLCRYMLSSEIVDLVGKNYVTGAAIKRVILKGIKQISVMLPPIELQNQFAAFVEQTDKSKLAIQQSLDKLETLKKSLMQEYFG